jgi:hypothetical protein
VIDLRDTSGATILVRVTGPYLTPVDYTLTAVRQEGKAYLGGITIKDDSDVYGTNRLTASFNRVQLVYNNVNIPYTAVKLRVHAEADANNPDAGMEIKLGADGGTDLGGGTREFSLVGSPGALEVKVSGEYLEPTTYIFNLSRVQPRAYLDNLKIKTKGNGGEASGGSYTGLEPVPGFSAEKLAGYQVNVPWDTYEVTLEGPVRYAGREVLSTDQDEAPGGTSRVFPGGGDKTESRIRMTWGHSGGLAIPETYTVLLSRAVRKAELEDLDLEASASAGDEDFSDGLVVSGIGPFSGAKTTYTAQVSGTAKRVRVIPGLNGPGTLSYTVNGEEAGTGSAVTVSFGGTTTVEVILRGVPFRTENRYTVVISRPSAYDVRVPADTEDNGQVRVTAEVGDQWVRVMNAMPGDRLRLTVSPNLGYDFSGWPRRG